MEKWNDVKGFEGLYKVSNMGNIKSVTRKVKNGKREMFLNGKILKQFDDGSCLSVMLSKNGKPKKYRVHKLVTRSFIGEIPNNYEILHENGNYKDNRLSNLNYDTKSQNQIDIYRHGGKTSKGKLELEEVLKIRNKYKTGKYSQKQLGYMFKTSQSNIWRIVNRKIYQWLDDEGNILKSDSKVS